MSDASEVKRWWVSGFDIAYQPLEHEVWTVFFTEFDPGRKEAFQVMPVEDHDRIVVELKATIARQAKVIEKLMEQISELTMDEIADRYDLEAIEQEQGEGT